MRGIFVARVVVKYTSSLASLLAHCCEHAVQRRVALVHPAFHTRPQESAGLSGRMEERSGDEPRAAITKVFQRRGIDNHVGRHSVPLERLNHTLRRRNFAKATFEAMHTLGGVLDESPVSATFHLQPLDHQLVAPPPPFPAALGIGHRLPHPLAWRVEDSLEVDLAIGGWRDSCVLLVVL